MSFDKSKFLTGPVPVEREVTLPDGSKETMHFIVPSAAEVRRWTAAEREGGEDALYGMQRLIAASLYDPQKKKLALSGDDYKHLTYEGCESLLPHVIDIAGVNKAKKPSPNAEPNGSDTSSP